MGNRSYLRENWLGIVGLLIGALGAFASVYTYIKTQRFREPMFVVDPTRTEILSKERVTQAPIRVTRSDGRPITTDLTSVRFYFWNAGAEAIKQTDILDPITIALAEPGSEILDVRILKITRPVTKLQLAAIPGQPGRLSLTFGILEQNDGVTGQVIIQGRPDARLAITGTIAGARIQTDAEIASGRRWREYANIFVYIAIALASYGVAWFVGWVERRLKAFQSERTAKYTKIVGATVTILGGFVLVVFLVYVGQQSISSAREKAAQNVVQTVPSQVRPVR